MKNPYYGLGPTETLNLQAHISKVDYHFIKCLSIRSGIIQAVASQLWKKLADRCRLDGITDFTKEEILTNYLENLTLPPIHPNGNATQQQPVIDNATNTSVTSTPISTTDHARKTNMATDNRKAEAIKHLESAKEKWPTASQANQIKLAIARWHLDELGEKDAKTRRDVITAFMEMPSWFGASANAMMELDSYVKKAKRSVALPEGC